MRLENLQRLGRVKSDMLSKKYKVRMASEAKLEE